MGGINHKPTKNIQLIAESAWLSQKVSEGMRAVWDANSALEDAILAVHGGEAGLRGAEGTPEEHLRRSVALLEDSARSLEDIDGAYDTLFEGMRREEYEGAELAAQARRLAVGADLSGSVVLPHTLTEVWREVEDRVTQDNLEPTFRWEQQLFRELPDLTRALVRVLQSCVGIVESDGGEAFTEAVETNRVPLRQAYARVFSAWMHVSTVFLYSALLSTELFYRAEDMGTLREG